LQPIEKGTGLTPFPFPRPQEFASAGARVLRLKGGDPLLFGRGGEESDYLRAAGIAVAVTPGITAAAGIAAELGIPLTHRGVAASVRFVTGHSREGAEDTAEALLSVSGAVDSFTTLVLYMGLGTLPALAGALLAGGLSARTPCVAVERGTTVAQRRVFARLGGLAAATRDTALVSPTLVLIGGVVALSPLWPWAREGDASSAANAGGDLEWRLQSGPVRYSDDDAASAQAPTWVSLPEGGRVALPQPQRAAA
jgi:siroheme synthase